MDEHRFCSAAGQPLNPADGPPLVAATIAASIDDDHRFAAVLAGCREELVELVPMVVGKRAANLARAFNLRAGIGAELDRPSMRYGSTPLDGLLAGHGIMPHWDSMLKNYYEKMGWDVSTGVPLPETLINLELEDVVPHLRP